MRFTAPTPLLSRPVRVCCIQYCLRPARSFQAFADQVETWVDVADDYDADLVLFPELLGAQLLGCLSRGLEPGTAMAALADAYADPFEELFTRLARDYERLPQTLAGLHVIAFVSLMLAKATAAFDLVRNTRPC